MTDIKITIKTANIEIMATVFFTVLDYHILSDLSSHSYSSYIHSLDKPKSSPSVNSAGISYKNLEGDP